MSSINFLSIPTKVLADSITSASSSFRLNNIKGWDGSDLEAADFGETAYGIFRNATNSVVEFFEYDPTTIANGPITITRRGLAYNPTDLTTEVTANKLSWTKGDTYVDLGTDTPQILQWLKEYIDAASIAGAVPMTPSVQGIAKLSTAAASASDPIVVGDNDPRIPTSDENAALAGDGGSPSETNPVKLKSRTLTAGETIAGATTPVPVYQSQSDNELYACDANDNTKYKFTGFAISTANDGGNIEFQDSGVVSGFTSLEEGKKYYVQDTAGAIGTSPGTFEILVGIAISETQLLIQRGVAYSAGQTNAGLVTATGSEAITIGFRPSIVRVRAKAASSNFVSMMDMTWVASGNYGSGAAYNEGSSGTISNNRLQNSGADNTDFLIFTITSVTDTGFTITYTESGTFSENVIYTWEAEGQL